MLHAEIASGNSLIHNIPMFRRKNVRVPVLREHERRGRGKQDWSLKGTLGHITSSATSLCSLIAWRPCTECKRLIGKYLLSSYSDQLSWVRQYRDRKEKKNIVSFLGES